MNNTQYMRLTNIKLINTKKKEIKYNKIEVSAYNLLAVILFLLPTHAVSVCYKIKVFK